MLQLFVLEVVYTSVKKGGCAYSFFQNKLLLIFGCISYRLKTKTTTKVLKRKRTLFGSTTPNKKDVEATRQYFSTFDHVMDNADASQVFRDYLEQQHNSEQILFLNKIKKIEDETQYTVQRGLGQYTIQSYLAEDCQFELNVSQQLKQAALLWLNNTLKEEEHKIISEEEEITKQKQLISIFEKLKKEIRFQLAVECFPQFLDSTVFKDFCSHYNKSFS